MKRTLKKYFIPQAENNFHPHMLHAKRAVFYGVFFVCLKLIVFIFVLALPTRVFMLPDVLAQEQKKMLAFTNELRAQKGLPRLKEAGRLNTSSQNKANDMATYGYFSHVSPDRKTVADWIKASGYAYSVAGENLALGFSTAADVVTAWINSPTHYANLVDTDFADVGVGMQEGRYGDSPTVFVAEHFAAPRISIGVNTAKASVSKKPPAPQAYASAAVLSEKEEAPVIISPSIALNAERSRIYWQEKDGGTLLIAHADISGPVQSAVVTVGSYQIPLARTTDTLYTGTFLVHEPAETFFKILVPPSIRIVGTDGTLIESQITWFNIKVAGLTPIAKYIRSKDDLGFLTNLFAVQSWVYLSFILFFGTALLLMIFIEIKRQHPKVIAQTVSLLVLLLVMYRW